MATIESSQEIQEKDKIIKDLALELNFLRNEKKWLKAILEAMPVGIFLADEDGRIFQTNELVHRIWGTAPHLDNIKDYSKYKGWWTASGDPINAEEWALARAITKGETSIGEIIDIERFDGKSASILNSASPVQDDNGNIIGAVALIQDITEQRKIEEEIRTDHSYLEEIVERRTKELKATNKQLDQANRQIRNILESISDGFYALDSNWSFTYINNQAESYFQKSKNELIGRNIWSLYPNLIDTAFYEYFHKTMNDKIPYELETQDKDLNWAEVKSFPNEDGISVYVRDITARKKMEEALRLSEERFSKYFHNSPDIMVLSDIETGEYLDVNQAFLNTFGYERNEVIGNTAEELIYELGVRKKLKRIIDKKGKIENLEVKFHSKTGEIITLLVSVDYIEINGRAYFLSSSKNITEFRKLEKKMSRFERLNLIAQMAGGIGHEVRNPLTTIKGFLQILSEKEKYQDDIEYFKIMIEELDRANTILSEFLSLAKNRQANLTKYNINNIINSMYPLLAADALKQSKNLILDTGKIPDLLLDDKEIRQLILNLVRNGLEAMEQGKNITIKTYTEKEEVILLIKDEGHGIPNKILDKIGTPFFTTKENGTGLGLSICFKIAEKHNARINVESSSKGTIFFIKFKKKEV